MSLIINIFRSFGHLRWAEWFGAALYHVNIIACKIRYNLGVLQVSERVFGGFLDSLRSLEMTGGAGISAQKTGFCVNPGGQKPKSAQKPEFCVNFALEMRKSAQMPEICVNLPKNSRRADHRRAALAPQGLYFWVITIPPGQASTMMVDSLWMRPSRISRARRLTSSRCMSRLTGRAPKEGS